MSSPFVASIVEGHGEGLAVPVLLRRIAATVSPEMSPRLNPPIRVKVGSFLNDDAYFTKYLTLAAAKAAQENGFVFILLDLEDGCPAKTGPEILRKAQTVRPDIDYIVALAYREYETWFLQAAESLRGHRGLPNNLDAPPEPEAIRGAKEWLGRQMPHGYDPVLDQASFTATFDFCQAAWNPSFRRTLRIVRRQFRTFLPDC